MAASMVPVDDVNNNDNTEDIDRDLACLDVFGEDCLLNSKRPTCERCKRPQTVCWCPFLPGERIDIKTTIYILQHPYEETRCLKTVPMLQNSISENKCHVVKGKRFGSKRCPSLAAMLASPSTVLLYPGDDAIDLAELPTDVTWTLVLLDGTWPQARGIYAQNPCVRALKKVKITSDRISKYVIRTQPYDAALSTLETAAIAVATLEKRPDLADTLIYPLEALCDFQIQHGAVKHHSKQWKMENGTWDKPISKKDTNRLRRKREGKVS